MAKMKTGTFDEIVRLAGDFVTKQKGVWDHTAWLGFLSTLQKKGFDVSDEMQAYVGQLLEAMKRFYQATASIRGIEKALTSVAKDSVQFVKAHKAVWGHSDWEAFARHVQKNTLSLSEETTNYLGGILESVKDFYAISPVTVSRPEEPAAPPAPRSRPEEAAAPPAPPSRPEEAAAPPAPPSRPEEAAVVTVEREQVKETVTAPVEDDLTAIAGIGPALQRKLKEQGIHSFAQIAALSDADIERLEENIIKFPGRIKRDDWVGQAQRLSNELR